MASFLATLACTPITIFSRRSNLFALDTAWQLFICMFCKLNNSYDVPIKDIEAQASVATMLNNAMQPVKTKKIKNNNV